MQGEIVVGAANELKPGERKLAFVDGQSIVLFNIVGTIYAIENACPHNGASLASGKLDGAILCCPAHGLRFDVTTGCMPGGKGLCLKTFAVRAVDGKMVVALDEPAEPECHRQVCAGADNKERS